MSAAFAARDAQLMRDGTHAHLGDVLGAHVEPGGTRFAVWAPHAVAASVIGDFNGWRPGAHPLAPVGDSGVWQGVVPGVGDGALYKYALEGPNGFRVAKADPYARRQERPPGTASVVWDRRYAWGDAAWLARRAAAGDARRRPMAIYEVHLGSWRRVPEDGDRPLTYREAAPRLAEHATRLGFTHVELLPLAEHPFYGSWGYETTGYFAPTARYGEPEELMRLVDTLHQAGLGVILDWVPAHFPNDEHGLVYFDGAPLYEYADPRRGYHPEWNTCIFDFGRPEVRSFLVSSALAWLDRFHLDGLRVDGVATMLYRDYGRKPGEWVANARGGNENDEAVALLRQLNEAVHREHPDCVTLAEESTAWPKVTAPPADGGLGFDFKWDMGWMHDTLRYFARDPIHRRHHHGELTFRGLYMFAEAFVLPLSHDEVVYGKRSLVGKMPGDRWQQFANLRLLYAYMYSQPGKKLLFMGGEFAQDREWNHDTSLDWHLLDGRDSLPAGSAAAGGRGVGDEPAHRQLALLVGELDRLYRTEPALYERDCEAGGFHWLVADDAEQGTMAYERVADGGERVVVALNLTPLPRANYRVGVLAPGWWDEILNTDAREFGGSGVGNLGAVEASPVRAHGRELSLSLTLPPLGAVLLRRRR